jgi:hypothetical protein
MRKALLLSGAALMIAGTMCLPAQAGVIVVDSTVGGAPTGAIRENFDSVGAAASSGGQTLSSGITLMLMPDAAVVTGNSGGVYAAPFLSGGNGAGFGAGGTTQADGVDTTRYLTTGSTSANANSRIIFTLPSLQGYLGLLWGSVDLYNTLTFYAGNSLIGSITGGDVQANATGDQGLNGTRYVNINATGGTLFDRVVATSSSFAFEIDNVAFQVTPVSVPEPASIALFGIGLAGLSMVRRRRSRQAA